MTSRRAPPAYYFRFLPRREGFSEEETHRNRTKGVALCRVNLCLVKIQTDSGEALNILPVPPPSITAAPPRRWAGQGKGAGQGGCSGGRAESHGVPT